MKRVQDNLVFSPFDLANSLRCQHLVEVEHQVALGKRTRPIYRDPVMEALRLRGQEHERAYLAHLQTRYEVAIVSDAPEDRSALERTKALIQSGYEIIYQPELASPSGDWSGRADFLRKVERPSKLGAYSYEVIDTKLALETKAETLLQLCVYADLLGELQGCLPEYVYVVTPGEDFSEVAYRVAEFGAYYRQLKGALPSSLHQELHSYPDAVSHCDQCNWQTQCDRQRRDDDHLCLVAGLTRVQQNELTARDITTLEAFAATPSPLPFRPSRGSGDSLNRSHKQAQIQSQGRREGKVVHQLLLPVEEGRGLALLPEPSPGDLFLDLEGDPFIGQHGLEYLFGWLAYEDEAWGYQAIWSRSPQEERAAFERFMDCATERAARYPGMHIYHYAPYEPGAMKRLAGRYGTRVDALDDLLRGQRFVDLYRVVKQALVASVERYSIKDLEPLFGFSRTVDLKEVGSHKRAVEALLQLRAPTLPSESLDVVERYNVDDCRSAQALRDWLEAQRAMLLDQGEAILRPMPVEDKASENLSEWLARIQNLETALLSDLPEAERTTDEQARWLLAHLLQWHRREDKCDSWERYRLSDLEPEDLLYERKAVAGMVHAGEVDKSAYNPKLRTPVHRFTLPAQVLEVRPGQKLLLCGDKQPKFGEVLGVDQAGDWIDVRTAKAFAPEAAEKAAGAFVDESFDSKSLAAANERIATQAVEDGCDIARSNPLAAKLLRRTPMPNLPLTLEQPWHIVDHLDGDIVPVQGPPGAGKTFTGARMILRLCQAGKKVGITANSHSVINNLLREVHAAALAEKLPPPRLMQKACPEKVSADDVIAVRNDNSVMDALRNGEVDVLGGTAWLWTSDGCADLVDTLFVDEAGQMSLANVLACTPCTGNMVLLGDPQQLTQPTQATHPEGTEVSALQHLIGQDTAMPADRGLFLAQTYRMHPSICDYISEQFYAGKLVSAPGRDRQQISGVPELGESGLAYLPILHSDNASSCQEEADAIVSLVRQLLASAHFTDHEGETSKIGADDILILAPFNAQVQLIQQTLAEEGEEEIRVGTVDRFQGKQAPVVIYSCTSSSVEDAPRGMEFLFDPHRFNVAISRAKALAIMLCSPALRMPKVRSPQQMRLANTLARYLELARDLSVGVEQSASTIPMDAATERTSNVR